MFPPFPESEAKQECLLLIEQLEKSGCMDFCVEEEFRNPKFSLEYAKNNCGIMMGVLVCKIPDTNKKVVLKAFSGQYNSNWQIPGWVNPCFEVEKWQNEVNRADPKIKELTRKIEEFVNKEKLYGEDGKILHQLRKERKHHITRSISLFSIQQKTEVHLTKETQQSMPLEKKGMLSKQPEHPLQQQQTYP